MEEKAMYYSCFDKVDNSLTVLKAAEFFDVYVKCIFEETRSIPVLPLGGGICEALEERASMFWKKRSARTK